MQRKLDINICVNSPSRNRVCSSSSHIHNQTEAKTLPFGHNWWDPGAKNAEGGSLTSIPNTSLILSFLFFKRKISIFLPSPNFFPQCLSMKKSDTFSSWRNFFYISTGVYQFDMTRFAKCNFDIWETFAAFSCCFVLYPTKDTLLLSISRWYKPSNKKDSTTH